ncbi:MAG: nuclear transport factor 2 family protein [Gemmatimonadales bacterium]
MRRFRAVLLGTVICSTTTATLHAQKAARPASSSSVQKAVFALEEEWTRGLVKGDTLTFKRLTAPGFVYTEDNVVMNQRELIRAIATSTDKIEWAGNEAMKLYDYNPVAVVTGVLVVKGRNKSGKFTNRYRFTDTWLYRNGKWQAIAAQDYLIPK